MKNPIIEIKNDIVDLINQFLQEKFLDRSNLSYDYKRDCLQTALLFTKSEEARISYKNKLRKFYSNDFNLHITDNYINIKLSPSRINSFLLKFTQYINFINKDLIPVDYFLYTKTKADLNNYEPKAFINTQSNLLNFYGYSVNKVIKEESLNNKTSVEFKLSDFYYSQKISNLFKNQFPFDKFSPNYLNLVILSRKINSLSNDLNLLKKSNTKNPLYVTAYVIARLNHLTYDNNLVNDIIIHNKVASINLLLADVLENKKTALSLTPLIEILINTCKDVYINDFYCFKLDNLSYHISIINFLTNISQTTFFYY